MFHAMLPHALWASLSISFASNAAAAQATQAGESRDPSFESS